MAILQLILYPELFRFILFQIKPNQAQGENLEKLKMSIIQSCGDTKDCVDLFRPQGLYLKPIAR